MRIPSRLLMLSSTVLGGPAAAHVTLAPDAAAAGSYYAGVLRVSHGCDGSPTVAIRVEIPASVTSAKPQPKPGWTLRIERAPLAAPVKTEGGRTQGQRVAAITWRGGPLPDDEFDGFGLMLRTPAQVGPLYLPTVQTCESGRTAWTDIPAPGQAWHGVPHPAPVLNLTSAAPAAPGMAGMDHP